MGTLMKGQRYGRGRFVPGRRRVAVIWAVVFALMVAYPPFAASDVTVGTCAGPLTFTSIQAAVTAAPSGSTVRICPGMKRARECLRQRGKQETTFRKTTSSTSAIRS